MHILTSETFVYFFNRLRHSCTKIPRRFWFKHKTHIPKKPHININFPMHINNAKAQQRNPTIKAHVIFRIKKKNHYRKSFRSPHKTRLYQISDNGAFPARKSAFPRTRTHTYVLFTCVCIFLVFRILCPRDILFRGEYRCTVDLLSLRPKSVEIFAQGTPFYRTINRA